MELERAAATIIERAEAELATLASQAAAQRNYLQAASLIAMAQHVAAAAKLKGDSAAGSDGVDAVVRATLLDPIAGDGVSESLSMKASESRPSRPKATAASRRPASGDSRYPRFKHEGDTLVKIGWSKTDRSTYEHRSPKDVILRLVEKVKQFGVADERITTEQLMPLLDDSGDELPSYQAYLCLAWLVSVGVLEKHGRQGYTIAVVGGLDQAVESAWSALPTR